jgi:uncharacterized phage protein (TIGR02220 family)
MDYISIKNLEKYQPSYIDGRAIIWIRWDISAIGDYRISKLTPSQRWLFIGLICVACKQKNTIPLDEKWISEEVKYPLKSIRNDLNMLQKYELIVTNCNKMLQNVLTDICITDICITDIHKAKEIFDYFLLKTKKSLKYTQGRQGIIELRFKDGFTSEQMKQAIDNFVLDDWVERHKFVDIVYCLGIRNKVDNLEKWLNYKPKPPQKEVKYV